jgi:hypothetical protein
MGDGVRERQDSLKEVGQGTTGDLSPLPLLPQGLFFSLSGGRYKQGGESKSSETEPRVPRGGASNEKQDHQSGTPYQTLGEQFSLGPRRVSLPSEKEKKKKEPKKTSGHGFDSISHSRL